MMNYISLNVQNVEITEFVDFWRKAYNDSDKKYHEHMKNHPKSKEDIKALFEWKNGGKLSERKQKSLETKIISNLETINSLSQNFDLDKFNTKFKRVSAIWKFFLLHIIHPERYPMLDQYVMRALCFLVDGIISAEIPSKDSEKEDFYNNHYVEFFNDLANQTKSKYTRKQVDESLWAFGKFLKSDFHKMLQFPSGCKASGSCRKSLHLNSGRN